MNCEEYKEAIATDPSASFAGDDAHASGCDACSKYRDEMRALDERIARALAIDVPELRLPDLPYIEPAGGEKSAAAANPGAPGIRSPFMSPPLWVGLAAAIALVAILFTGLPETRTDHRQLVAEIVAHMDHEQASRQVTSVPVPAQTLHAVVDPKVAAMDRDVGLITYAMSCVINGRTVPHLVIQGSTGPVTLILLPDETIESPLSLVGQNVQGVLLPVGHGSIAVIGQREDQMDEIDRIGKELADSVEWSI
ncbi:MAG TPA: DUF3379 family protein [Woeseiaceae bacterium]|nr:DUF3379 family protein [Woeseiaceae bacterium]